MVPFGTSEGKTFLKGIWKFTLEIYLRAPGV